MQRVLFVSLFCGLVGLGWVPGVGAQTTIIPDTTLPGGLSLVTTVGVRDEIRGGVVSGPNLFHSFSGFGVAEGRAAYFVPGSGVESILTRVTGGQGSNIFGTLGVVGDASLFLLNPNGIVFGAGSRLDVAGSFVGTTATSFEFGGGLSFGAVNPGGAPVLTTSVSPGLQLGAMGAGAIESSGQLAVGKDLRLSSRGMVIEGGLLAERNLILEGVEQSGIVGLQSTGGLVLRAGGDVIFGNYNGASLHIFAGGSVTGKNITITGPSTRGLIDEEVILSDGVTNIHVNGDWWPTLDIRAGTGIWQTNNSSGYGMSIDNDSSIDIGSIRNAMGDVFLSNKYKLDVDTFTANIQVDSIDTKNDFSSSQIPDASTPRFIAIDSSNEISISNNINAGLSGWIHPKGRHHFGSEIRLISEGNMNLNDVSNNFFMATGLSSDSVKSGNIFITSGESIIAGSFSSRGTISARQNDEFSDVVSFNINSGDVHLEARGDILIDNITSGTISSAEKFMGGSINPATNIRESETKKPEISMNMKGGNIDLNAGGRVEFNEISSLTGSGLYIAWSSCIQDCNSAIIKSNISLEAGNASIRADGNINGNKIDVSVGGTNQVFWTAFPSGSAVKREFHSFARSGSVLIDSGSDIEINKISTETKVRHRGLASNLEIDTLELAVGERGVITVIANGNISLPGNESSTDLNGINSSGFGAGGDIYLLATNGSININNSLINGSSTGATGIKTFLGEQAASLIDINSSGPIQIRKSSIESSLPGQGSTGRIKISSDDNVEIRGSRIDASVNSENYSGSSDILISGKSLLFGDSSIIDIANFGRGALIGNTNLISLGNISFENSSIFGATAGKTGAGKIAIQSGGSLFLSGGSAIATSALLGSEGNGGNIEIQAQNGVVIDGRDAAQVIERNISSNPNINALDLAKGVELNISDSFALDSRDSRNPDVRLSDQVPYVAIRGQVKGGPIPNPPDPDSDNFSVNVGSRGARAFWDFVGNPQIDITIVDPEGIAVRPSSENFTFRQAGVHKLIIKTFLPDSVVDYKLLFSIDESSVRTGVSAQAESIGGAGNITVQSPSLSIANGGQINTSTIKLASGTAGDIILQPWNNGNNLKVVLQNGNISAETSSSGKGGNLQLNAPESVTITGQGTISAQTSGPGRAGNVEITTNQLNLDSGTNITTTATSTSTTTEPGGSITLTANQMNLLGNIAILAETQGNTPAGSLTLQSNNSPTLNINLADNSRVSASTSSSGPGGSLTITAPDTINITGNGTLSAETSGIGKAGDILINTQNLNISNNTQISTSTTSSGAGGNLRITAPNSINLSDQAQLISQSTASGKAGNITLTSDKITLNNSKAAVSSQGTGNGGDLNLSARNLQLKQNSQLTASTASGEGGNLNLTVSDILLMRQGSRIETNAGSKGNGGDININNSTGFIVAVDPENSDITANALAGNGGTINLSSSGLFGIQFRPKLTPNSDITASSDSGVQGTVSVNTPNVDPSKGLNELPSIPNDGSNRIDNSCSAQSNISKSGSSFITSGRGGLPTRPGSPTNSFNTGDVRDFAPQLAQQPTPIPKPDQPLTEAQLSHTTPDGRVHLLAGRAITTPKPDCPDPTSIEK